jgi:hypothetical protein
LHLADDTEAVGAVEDDVEAAVLELLQPDDLADAADRVERLLRIVLHFDELGLNDCDKAIVVHGVANHFAIAGLEDVKRELGPRK